MSADLKDRRIAALWFPYLATERLERANPGLAERPVATILDVRGQTVLSNINPAAEKEGLNPGMTLANARAIYPDVTLLPDDSKADAALLEKLQAWCVNYTPWVALDLSNGLLLDVTGCAHLFGGEKAMLAEIVGRLDEIGLTVKAALAETPLAALALANHNRSGSIVPTGDVKKVLQPLPIEALRIGPDVAEDLHRVGLHKIRDLLTLPRSSLVSRFGLDLIRQIDRALGEQPHAISPKPYAPPYRVRLSFPDPIGTAEDIVRALDRLLRRMTDRLERDQRGCRKLSLSVFRADGEVSVLSAGVARAARDPHHLARLFAERLANLDPGFGIDSMVLAAPVVEDLHPDQQEATVRQKEAAVQKGDDPAFTHLLDRLAARVGADKLVRLSVQESHLPERAARFVSIFDQGEGDAPTHWPRGLAQRPTFLLRQPEAVDVEGRRMVERFRWRGRAYRVRRTVGPERLSPEWWRPPVELKKVSVLRDYYRVEDETGRRFWMYRSGQARTETDGTWYLHGLFT